MISASELSACMPFVTILHIIMHKGPQICLVETQTHVHTVITWPIKTQLHELTCNMQHEHATHVRTCPTHNNCWRTAIVKCYCGSKSRNCILWDSMTLKQYCTPQNEVRTELNLDASTSFTRVFSAGGVTHSYLYDYMHLLHRNQASSVWITSVRPSSSTLSWSGKYTDQILWTDFRRCIEHV